VTDPAGSKLPRRTTRGRPATGSLQWTKDKDGRWRWHARISLTDRSRPLVPLDPNILHEDTAGAAECAAKTSAYFRENGMAPDSTKETVAEYAAGWLVDREGRVNSIRDDRGRMNHHVLPVLGPLDVTRFGRDDVERLRDALDAKIADGTLSWKTAANCWTVITSMCSDMVSSKRRELRVRDDNATDKVRAPERGGHKAKQYLYPSEFLTFVSCDKIPLRWRRAVAVAVYTYTRDGELRVLRWDGGDVDLEHGVLSITRAYNRRTKDLKDTKTGESRRFAVEANLLPLLTAMRDESHAKGLVIVLPSERAMARNLRRWLWKANVRRPELDNGSPTRKQLTWHDLRATGATWMAVRGDDPLKIKQRCGHQTFSTTEIYIREAEAVREGFGEVFPALPAALRGPIGNSGRILARGRIPVTIGPKTRPFERGGRDSKATRCVASRGYLRNVAGFRALGRPERPPIPPRSTTRWTGPWTARRPSSWRSRRPSRKPRQQVATTWSSSWLDGSKRGPFVPLRESMRRTISPSRSGWPRRPASGRSWPRCRDSSMRSDASARAVG
jgi:integrase